MEESRPPGNILTGATFFSNTTHLPRSQPRILADNTTTYGLAPIVHALGGSPGASCSLDTSSAVQQHSAVLEGDTMTLHNVSPKSTVVMSPVQPTASRLIPPPHFVAAGAHHTTPPSAPVTTTTTTPNQHANAGCKYTSMPVFSRATNIRAPMYHAAAPAPTMMLVTNTMIAHPPPVLLPPPASTATATNTAHYPPPPPPPPLYSYAPPTQQATAPIYTATSNTATRAMSIEKPPQPPPPHVWNSMISGGVPPPSSAHHHYHHHGTCPHIAAPMTAPPHTPHQAVPVPSVRHRHAAASVTPPRHIPSVNSVIMPPQALNAGATPPPSVYPHHIYQQQAAQTNVLSLLQHKPSTSAIPPTTLAPYYNTPPPAPTYRNPLHPADSTIAPCNVNVPATAAGTGVTAKQSDLNRPRKKRKYRIKKGGPRRPCTSYNYFFMDERKRILESFDALDENKSEQGVNEEMWLQKYGISINYFQDKGKWEEHCMRKMKQRDNARKVKRDRKKTHGKISFEDLVRTVSARWNRLPPYPKEYYGRLGKADSERYHRELEKYNKNNDNT